MSVDFEDWHQLVLRRVGAEDWLRATPALERQTDALLSLLAELDLRCTFFILGMAARAYPRLVQAIARRGHEIACHGDMHLPVHAQGPDGFAEDLRASRDTVEQLTGATPIGYRAPAFSMPGREIWFYEVLAAEGFRYDSSRQGSGEMHPVQTDHGQTLWELPPAVWQVGGIRMPVGGASYWTVLPAPLLRCGLAAAGEKAGLYLHPHELDPEPLRPRRRVGAGGRCRRVRGDRLLRADDRDGACAPWPLSGAR